MGRLNVLFITTWYPTRQQPVAGVFVRECAKAVQLCDDVMVFHCAGFRIGLETTWCLEQEIDEKIREGVPTYRVWHSRSPIPKTSYLLQLWGVLRAFRCIIVQGFRPNIIHAHVYAAGVLADLIGKIYNIPVVVTEHSTEFPQKALSKGNLWKAKFAFQCADLVMPVSQALQQAIEAYGIKAQFQVIPNVVDTCLFYPVTYQRESRQVKRLLTVSLLDTSHKKGLPYLFRALTRMQQQREDWRLDIVGDGPARAEYEQMVANLKLDGKITFHGLKTKSQVAELMRQVDLLIVPSLLETFSVVAAEALATGLPVLTTRCGGPEEFVTPELGRVVPAGDANALCTELTCMLDDLHLYSRRQISEYALKHFSPEQVGARLHSIYHSLAS